MPKTPLLDPIQRELAALNDAFCFFLFAAAEIDRTLARFSPDLDTAYSTSVFADNPQARRIHVTLDTLRHFHAQNRTHSFAAYFATSYEVASAYYDGALSLLGTLGQRQLQPVNENKPEHRFAQVLVSSGYDAPPTELVTTLEFLRYRRNHWIHRNQTPSADYVALARDLGAAINAFWGPTREPLDFARPELRPFEEDETISLLKLLRLSIDRLDTLTASFLDPARILDHCARTALPPGQRINTLVLDATAPAVVAAAQREFGMAFPLDDARRALAALV